MSTFISSDHSPADGRSIVAALRAAGCVFAEDEARLLLEQAGSREELARLVRLRVGGLPLEQVLGWAEFCGLRVSIDPGVFVPRRRTELVAREAARLAGSLPAHGPIVAVDLCCGSGALAAALASLLDRPVDLYAADIDPAAVACARRNLASFGAQVYQGDLYAALPERLRGTVSILIANVPYVPTGEIALLPPEAREHEPRIALDGGGDGLDVLRAVAAGAPGWLAPGGHLLVEAGRRQLQLAQRILSDNLLIPILVEDEDGEATAVVATRPAPAG